MLAGPVIARGDPLRHAARAPNFMKPGSMKMVYRLWDELSAFPASRADDALVHLMQWFQQHLDADNVIWLGSLLMLDKKAAKSDPLLNSSTYSRRTLPLPHLGDCWQDGLHDRDNGSYSNSNQKAVDRLCDVCHWKGRRAALRRFRSNQFTCKCLHFGCFQRSGRSFVELL